MNQNEARFNLEDKLTKTRLVLERILTFIHSIDEHLNPIEQFLQEKEFTSRGAFVKRNPEFIVCIPTYLSSIIQEMMEKSILKPSLIWIDDSEESRYSCHQISQLIETQFLETSKNRKAILNIRSSLMIQPFEVKPTVMIGKRYILANNELLVQFTTNLKERGLQVFYDDKEFGGGPLVSTLIRTLDLPKDSFIVEFTLSQSVVKKIACLNAIMEALSSVWM